MKRIGYDLRHGDGFNFEKGRRIPLQPFVLKGKLANYYDQTRKGLGYVTPPAQYESDIDGSLPSHSSDSSDWESFIRLWSSSKNLFANMTSISRVEQNEDIEPFDVDPWAQ